MDKIQVVSIKDKEYPEALKRIPRAPKKLYFKGKLLPNEKCFAIVGTRLCTSYGKKAAMKIAEDLTEKNFTVVSGLAVGIDTYAHLAVIKKRKRTIAVLGTGLDEKSIYPKSNIGLSRKILETGGCLISEYPPGNRGSKFTFPERNRIISGLSTGVLVIEAKQKSGALITANWAKKQGIQVFALPGSIYSLNSKGCHYLIKSGAKLIENSDDILEQLKIEQKQQSFFLKKQI